MPKRPSNAAAWYYEDFLPTVQNGSIYENQPADWKRLRIWDNNELKPAMPEGFSGEPSEEQMQMLFAAMKQGKLFLFNLGEKDPVQYHYGIVTKRPLDPQLPAPIAPAPQEPPKPTVPNPEELGDDKAGLTEDQIQDYTKQWNDYNSQYINWSREDVNWRAQNERYQEELKLCEENKAFLDGMGDGFRASVNQINEERAPGMEHEVQLRNARRSNYANVQFKRKRESMDDTINQMMGPRPTAPIRVFFGGDPAVTNDLHSSNSDASLDYKVMDEELEANGYDLPANDKLNEKDVAIIHFALVAASEHMKQFTLDHMEVGGPVLSYSNVLDGYHMLITGMFGKNRKHQPGTPYLGEAMRLGKDVIGKYINDNDPKPLGEQLADSLRSIAICFAGYGLLDLTADMVGASKVVERVLNLLDTHADLKAAVGMSEQELEYLRGYANMGKAYDNYLDSTIKLNEAPTMEKPLSVEEKKVILADVAIREMIGAQLKKSIKAYEDSEEFLAKASEAALKDAELHQAELKWLQENGYNKPGANQTEGVKEYHKHHDYNAYTQALNSTAMDHAIIRWLGGPGNLEKLRDQLLRDPAIDQLAQKSDAELKTFVTSGDGVKQLAEMGQKAQNMVIDAPVWYASLKSQMLGGRPEHDTNAVSPWINANVPTDAERLLIAVDNGDGTKRLATVASLLANGLEDLRDPSAATMELLYQNALEGNLYYYDVGKDMPMRLSAEGQEPRISQMEFHEAPTFWMRVANFLTFGYAYADIIHPQADRDPAAYDAFAQARDVRGKAAQDEAVSRHDQARSSQQQKLEQNMDQRINFSQLKNGVKSTYPQYTEKTLQEKVGDEMHLNPKCKPVVAAQRRALTLMEISQVFSGKLQAGPEKVRELMAKLVLVEAAREEYALTGDDSGPITQGLSGNWDASVDGMLQNKTFQAFTEDASVEMLGHFLMVDGAKNMYKAMQKTALKEEQKESNKEKQENLSKEKDENHISSSKNLF